MACDDLNTADEALLAALVSPAEVSGDAGSVKQRSVSELIQAANYLAGKCAANSPRMGIRFSRLIPDGTVNAHPYRRFGCP
jgi:hypothetical protein